MRCLYNEIEPYCAAWLRNLIAAGHISAGDVDERSIVGLQPADLVGRRRFHAFAGIGVWDYALRLAGWPRGVGVWTGSCPCQPFSHAGKQEGAADARHLWPEWFRLIRECRPRCLIGEQVAGAIGHGWLDLVCADLEAEGYAVGAAVLGAHSVGAPHIRQRLYFVAHRDGERCDGEPVRLRERGPRQAGAEVAGRGPTDGVTVADTWSREREGDGLLALHGERTGAGSDQRLAGPGPTRGVADTEHPERRSVSGHREDVGNGDDDGRAQAHGEPRTRCEVCGSLADAEQWPAERRGPEWGSATCGVSGEVGEQRFRDDAGDGGNPWSDLVWLPCRDGKARPTQPGLFPLAHGAPARVGRLRAYGNAIVPQVAAAFIRAFIEAQGGLSCLGQSVDRGQVG